MYYSFQLYIVAFELSINIANLSSFPCGSLSKSTIFGKLPHNGVRVCSSSSNDGEALFGFVMCISFLLAFVFFASFLFSPIGVCCMCFCFFSSCVLKVPHESLIRVLTMDICATPLMTFKFLHMLWTCPSSHRASDPTSYSYLHFQQISNFPNVEIEHGKDINRHHNSSCWLCIMDMESQACMICFCLDI